MTVAGAPRSRGGGGKGIECLVKRFFDVIRFLLWAVSSAALLFFAVWFLNADELLLEGLYRLRSRACAAGRERA